MKMEQRECFQPSAYKNSDAGELPRRKHKTCKTFMISNFHCVLNVVCFLMGNSPASEFYKLTFQNTLSVPSS